MRTFLKKHLFNIVMIGIFILGIAIVAYPTISDRHNQKVQTRAIANYEQAVEALPDEEIEQMKRSAQLYNEALWNSEQSGTASPAGTDTYDEILDLNGDGIMGYLTIPTIEVNLPIYHGTSDEVLQVAVGHAESSSLPSGGENTHAVLLGHRGLPTASLFNDLDQLVVGDYFEIHILDETLYYEVYEISIVEPAELAKLRIRSGEDLVTLVTCTPYGINSHRLLIHGRRMDAPGTDNLLIRSEARRIKPVYVAIVVGIFLWAVLMLTILVMASRRRKYGQIAPEERMRRQKILSRYLKRHEKKKKKSERG